MKTAELSRRFSVALQDRRAAGLFRSLRDSCGLIDFSSNDYLGIASLKLLSADLSGSGATASRLLRGHTAQFDSLERQIAAFHRSESALICNSGYTANLALLGTVVNRHDTVLYASNLHASLRDGIRLSAARSFKFDQSDLSTLFRRSDRVSGQVFVVVESVCSMSGELAPVVELARYCEEKGFYLIVDEAHAVGVIGQSGRGLVCAHKLESKVFARVVTFGKSVGAFGAAVLCDRLTREYLINYARPFIYTTALPPMLLSTISAAYNLMEAHPEFQGELQSKISFFKQNAGPQVQSRLLASDVPIQAVIIPGNNSCKQAAEEIVSRGIDVRPILAPTVSAGAERLRVCVHRFNSNEDIRSLLSALESVV